MIDVEISSNTPVGLLDSVARAAIGAGCYGVSNRGGVTVIHIDDVGQNSQIANSILTSWNTLLVTSDKASITADGVDTATITHDSPDATLDYLVLLDGEGYADGGVTAVGGVVRLTLATDTLGIYTILLSRKMGNYATGQIMVTGI